mgnify:CR=1 FL=1
MALGRLACRRLFGAWQVSLLEIYEYGEDMDASPVTLFVKDKGGKPVNVGSLVCSVVGVKTLRKISASSDDARRGED